MAITLSNFLQRGCLKLGRKYVYVSTATNGSVSTVVDTKQGADFSDDDWNQGTIFIVRDAAGASAAPEGEFSQVTDSALVTTTYTWTIETVTAAVAAGDTFMATSSRLPKYVLIQKANEVLNSFANVPLWDTSLTMAAGTLEYTLPAGVLNLIGVYKQTSTDTGANEWKPYSDWKIQVATPGTSETLRIGSEDDGYKLGLEYEGVHPTVNAFGDVINKRISIELLACKLAVALYSYIGVDDSNREMFNFALNELGQAEKNHKIWTPQKQPKYLVYSRN
jgi:hypothetical protein